MSPPKPNPKVQKLKLKADEAYQQMKWKKALELYQEASEQIPNDVRMAQRMGDLLRRLNMKDEAIEQYKKAAKLYSSDGFWAKAIAIHKMILELDPNDVSIRRQLAETYSAQGAETKSRGTFSASVPSIPSTEERAAISISGEEPRTMNDRPQDESFIGGTVSISGGEPRTLDQPPAGPQPHLYDNPLGAPLRKFGSIPLFSEMSADELAAVLERLAIRRYPPGALVCEEGDIGSSMYIIAEGVVEVFTKDGEGKRLLLSQLRGGDFFGEFGLLTNGQRNASVQTKTDLELLEISSADLDHISNRYPRIWNVLEDYLRKRMIDTIVVKSSVFRVLTEEERQRMTDLLKLRKFKLDDVVMEQGSDGDEMFFVKSGKLLVTVQEGKERVVVGELGPGDYFGEMAMLTGKPRTASVRVKSEAELFSFARKDAALVLKGNREVLTRLKSKMDERTRETTEVFNSYKEARKTLDFV